MYLTYADYTGMGGNVAETAFPRLESKARAHLDRLTFGRLKNESPVRESVKYCMFDLVAAIESGESAGAMAAGREIASMSNDGVSISFAASGGARSDSARFASIVRGWLGGETTACGVPLLYAEVCAL